MSSVSWSEVLVASITDGPTLTAAAAASCIPTEAKYTFPPQYFKAGKILRIEMSGRISSVITTPGTARFDVRLGSAGSTVVFDSLAILLDSVAAHTNVHWSFGVDLVCRAAGSGTSTTFFPMNARFTSEDILGVPATAPKGVLTATLPWNTAPAVGAGCDNTANNVLDVFFTQTVATGSLTVHNYVVTVRN